MNKYKESIHYFENYIGVTSNSVTNNLVDEYVDILNELADKETPMKPTLKRGIHDIRCSKCGNPNLNTKWTYGRYCSGCGQKIDWSEKDE